jgi:hypothetical protein
MMCINQERMIYREKNVCSPPDFRWAFVPYTVRGRRRKGRMFRCPLHYRSRPGIMKAQQLMVSRLCKHAPSEGAFCFSAERPAGVSRKMSKRGSHGRWGGCFKGG